MPGVTWQGWRASTTTQFRFSAENSNAALPFTSCGPVHSQLTSSSCWSQGTTEYTQGLLFSGSASKACLKTLPRKAGLCRVLAGIPLKTPTLWFANMHQKSSTQQNPRRHSSIPLTQYLSLDFWFYFTCCNWGLISKLAKQRVAVHNMANRRKSHSFVSTG